MKPEDRTVPESGLTGWGAAKKILQRCSDDDRRMLLATLTRDCGVQTAPALEYTARLLRYHVDEADFPSQSSKLKQHELDYIERRVKAMLHPFIDVNDRRLGELRGIESRSEAA